jgi:hypothetical protein
MRLSILVIGLVAFSSFATSSANPSMGDWLKSVDGALESYADAFEVRSSPLLLP